MTDCKTIHLSHKDIGLVIDALVQARVSFELDAERECNVADRQRMLLETADCRKQAGGVPPDLCGYTGGGVPCTTICAED